MLQYGYHQFLNWWPQQSTGLLRLFKSLFFFPGQKITPIRWMGVIFWRRRRDLNPRYPFGVYTISNRARSASYATSPWRSAPADLHIILHERPFVKLYFYKISLNFSSKNIVRNTVIPVNIGFPIDGDTFIFRQTFAPLTSTKTINGPVVPVKSPP